jgi:hypothetical protein
MSVVPNSHYRMEAQRLKASVSIVAVIGETLRLKRDGHHFTASCPFHNERTPSFYVYSDHYHCFGCRAHGDVFDWLMKTRRMTFPEAGNYLGGPRQVMRGAPPVRPAPTSTKASATADAFMRCWSQGIDPAGTVVEVYLRARGGLTVPDGAPIRFHPRCQRGPSDLPGGPEFWPAMLALMTDPVSSEPVGLHRTYLRPDGSGKAPVAARGNKTLKAKMILGTWGVMRLAPDDQIGRAIGIAEGIENALTASQIIGWGPVWAAGTLGCIKSLPVLPGIETLHIFPDADDCGVGLEAARACGKRWLVAGREVLIHVPPTGKDWNDAIGVLTP